MLMISSFCLDCSFIFLLLFFRISNTKHSLDSACIYFILFSNKQYQQDFFYLSWLSWQVKKCRIKKKTEIQWWEGGHFFFARKYALLFDMGLEFFIVRRANELLLWLCMSFYKWVSSLSFATRDFLTSLKFIFFAKNF